MSEQPQPEAVWVFPEDKKKGRGGRIALTIGLVVLALVAIGVVALFLIPRDDRPAVAPTSSPSSTPTPSAAPTTASPVPTAAPTVAPTPEVPDIAAFRDQVGFRIVTAGEGLDLIAQGQDPQGTVTKLQGDAQRIADVAAPTSIEQGWSAALQDYMAALDALSLNPADAAALAKARGAVAELTALLQS
ncbi:MAG: hypothetical protein JSS74_00760 [Actinobacteria bacterium]|nr:hypothetical protein [Actinomycetota bacterium]